MIKQIDNTNELQFKLIKLFQCFMDFADGNFFAAIPVWCQRCCCWSWTVAVCLIFLPRTYSDIKFCYLELSQQQATCCHESTSQQVACCQGSSRQQNFMSEYVLGNNNLKKI